MNDLRLLGSTFRTEEGTRKSNACLFLDLLERSKRFWNGILGPRRG
jgi:hypothetical protein